MSSPTSARLTATASANQGSSSPALMRMGVVPVRADATEFLSTGEGATKAEAPPTRSAAMKHVLGAMMLLSHVVQLTERVRPSRVASEQKSEHEMEAFFVLAGRGYRETSPAPGGSEVREVQHAKK